MLFSIGLFSVLPWWAALIILVVIIVAVTAFVLFCKKRTNHIKRENKKIKSLQEVWKDLKKEDSKKE